jgi:hypothetical protein
MVRLLAIFIALLTQAEASMQSSQSLPPTDVCNASDSSPYSDVPEDLKHYGHIQTECPKECYVYSETAGLCLPQSDEVGKVIYKSGPFYNRDYNTVQIIPEIPNLTTIERPSDILRIAKFFKDYINAFTRYFIDSQHEMRQSLGSSYGVFQYDKSLSFAENQNVMNKVLRRNYDAFEREPNCILDLVRPSDESNSVRERLDSRINKALHSKKWNEYEIIKSLCSSTQYFSWAEDDIYRSFWKQVYEPNQDVKDAAMRFAHMVYVDKPDIQAFATDADFNAALMEIDPDFIPLLWEMK